MKKRLLILLVLALLLCACIIKNNSNSHVVIDIPQTIDIVRFNDDNVVSREPFEFKQESNSAKDIRFFIQNDTFYDFIHKPFYNLSVGLDLSIERKRGMPVFDLLELFNIDKRDVGSYDFSKVKKYEIVRIIHDSIAIYLMAIDKELFKIFLIELNSESENYKSRLPLLSNKTDVINMLGSPYFFSKSEDVFIYRDTNLFQINIYFTNNKISKIQYMVWEGV